MQDQNQAGDAEPQWVSGLLMAVIAACAALSVVAVIWAMYASLDEQGFALDRSVVQPVMAWFSGPPSSATASAAAPAQGTVVAGQRGTGQHHP